MTSPESARAASAITHQIGLPDSDTEMVVVKVSHGSVADPVSRSQIAALASKLSALGPDIVTRVQSPFAPGATHLVSANGTTALIPVTMAGNATKAVDNIPKVLTVAADAAHDGLLAQVAGQAASSYDSNQTAKSDLSTGESIGIPVALIVLLIVFGTLASALLPIGLAIAAIVVALAETALIGQAYQLSFFVTNMITMMGLAVGIDYVLFIVSRYREERAKGSAVETAIAISSQTASRAVLFSGITVVVALVGLLIVPTTIFLSLALGAILVVTAAVAAALTLLPAALVLLGDRLEMGRVEPADAERLRRGRTEGGGFWPRAVGAVMSRPVISLVTVVALLLLAAVPYLGIKTGANGVTSLPHTATSRQAYETMKSEFPIGSLSPARIPLVGDPNSTENQAAGRSDPAGHRRQPAVRPGVPRAGSVEQGRRARRADQRRADSSAATDAVKACAP